MSLSSLPTEILRGIGRRITSLSTLHALSCVNRHFYAILNELLYQVDARCDPAFALVWAAEHGVMETVQKALSHGAQIPATSLAGKVSTGETRIIDGNGIADHFFQCSSPHPLFLAVQNGHEDIIELLLKKGCNVNIRDPKGLTLLCVAVTHDHLHIVRILLSRGARHERQPIASHSPIQIAASKGAKEIVDCLVHYGPDFTRPSARQLQDAIAIALREGHKHILSPLLETGVSLNFGFWECGAPSAYTPLLWALEEGDTQLLTLLLAGGNADPNYGIGNEDHIPLLQAVMKNQEQMVRILVGLTSRLHRTRALALSMDYCDGRMAQILLENGTLPDFEVLDDTRVKQEFNCNLGCEPYPLMPPIIRAVRHGFTNLVKLLVTHGANVNVGYRGRIEELPRWTFGGALDLAMQLGHQETADFLRDQGATEDVEDEMMVQFKNWSYNWPSNLGSTSI